MISPKNLYLWFYRGLLHLLPARMRALHGDEMVRLVSDRIEPDAETANAGIHWRRAWIELVDVLVVAFANRTSREVDGELPSNLPVSTMTPRERWNFQFGQAFRRLVRRPAFAFMVVVILGLGVGTATSIFAVVDALLLRPLPFANSSRLVMVWRTVPSANLTRSTTSYPDFLDWQASATAFSSLAAFTGTAGVFPDANGAERVDGTRVSGNLFATLGSAPAMGRAIVATDDNPSAERTIVLSDALWRRRFGADTGILQQRVKIGENEYRVVGVMAADFSFPSARSQFWTPLRLDASRAERDANFLTVIGRLRNGFAIETAQAEIRAEVQRTALRYPDMNTGYGTWLEQRHAFVVREIRQALQLLCAAVLVLLTIACANVANLNLVRGVARARELSLRRTLGATKWRLAIDQLAESVCIGTASAMLATSIGALIVKAIVVLSPSLPRASEVTFGARPVLFSAIVSMLLSATLGIFPYLGALSRAEASASTSRTTFGRVSRRLQQSFVAAQLALTLMLVVAAGLLGQSFYRLVSVPRGFQGERVLTAKLSLPSARYASHDAVLQFYDRLTRQFEAIPGVESASATWALPFSNDLASSTIVPADQPMPAKPRAIATLPVRERFFSTLGVPLRFGRDFSVADRANSPAVAIVNETLARSFWGTTNVVGKELQQADTSNGTARITIVGVVADMKRRGLDVPTEPEVYWPHAQAEWARGDMYVTLRVSGDPTSYVTAMRRAVTEQDAMLPLTAVGSLEHFVGTTVVDSRFRTILVVTFAALAGLLAIVGVYASVSFAVAQRKLEIAVRGALGATPRRLFADVLVAGMSIAAVGLLGGFLGASAIVPVMRSLLFGIDPFDVATFVGAACILLAAVAVACWLPARRAARIDPMNVLREAAG